MFLNEIFLLLLVIYFCKFKSLTINILSTANHNKPNNCLHTNEKYLKVLLKVFLFMKVSIQLSFNNNGVFGKPETESYLS